MRTVSSQRQGKVHEKMLEKPLHSVNLIYENAGECGILIRCILVIRVIECLIGIINVQTYHLLIPSTEQAFYFTDYMI
jgi:hypothetical protein